MKTTTIDNVAYEVPDAVAEHIESIGDESARRWAKLADLEEDKEDLEDALETAQRGIRDTKQLKTLVHDLTAMLQRLVMDNHAPTRVELAEIESRVDAATGDYQRLVS